MIGLALKANISIGLVGIKVYQKPNKPFHYIEKIKWNN